MDESDRSESGEENLAVGDTPTGNPPFLVYKRRLYVLSKKPPALRRGDEAAPRALEVQARPGQRYRAPAGHPVRRAARTRTRPFVKGTYRVYSSRFPHLAPTGRKKTRKRTSK
jgi:hypothetical protein